MKRILLFLVIILSSGAAAPLRAQFYSNGASPASLRWGQIRTDSLRMIFPLEFEDNARRTLYYMDSVRPHVGYGFRYGPLRTPVVMHTENFFANGLGILAPKRIEIGGLPGLTPYATPWLKQLAAHEYRHMVQYANINRSTVKALSYIFGEQVVLLCTGVLPFWLLEGDATMAETQFSEFGRGLQPSFTMHYRATADELTARWNPDKWFCGSIRDYVPSHYELGYQLVAHSERKYGEYIWDKVARYGANFPFLLFTTQLALNKYYGTSTRKLYHDTFGYLTHYWASLPERENSASVVSRPRRTYTVCEHPLFLGDSTLLVLRTDYDRAQRFVTINLNDGSERTLCYTGMVSTRPAYYGGRVFWTEYVQTMWEQRNDSRIRYMEVGEWKPRGLGDERAALYATPTPDGLAYVKYHYEGLYSIVRGEESYTFPKGTSLHGLAFDDRTGAFYYIALDDDGMHIGGLRFSGGAGRTFVIKPSSRVTVSDLRAEGGKLYFGSIYSGYDEAHTIDLATGVESRLTVSRYGSFSPAPSPEGGAVAVTVYGREGYAAAVQPAEPVERIPQAILPLNVVNPPTADWGLPCIDSLTFSGSDLEASREESRMRRYRKGANIFNFHSWAPLNFDSERFMNNFDFNNMNLVGVSAVSQNLLSTATTALGYGYSLNTGHSLVRARFDYTGLAPKFGVDATWSDSGQPVYVTSNPQPDPGFRSRNYFAVNGTVHLPLILSAGNKNRSLTPTVQYIFRNSLFYDPFEGVYRNNEHIVAGALSFVGSVRRAPLDLVPRWGYAVRARIVTEPGNNIYMPTASAYGRVRTPGAVRTHGVSLEATYQQAFGDGFVPFSVLDILPRGCPNINPMRYAAASARYIFPVAYPDWGLSGVFFLKRIYMNVGIDIAGYEAERIYQDGHREPMKGSMYSYGGAVSFDVGFLRLPAPGTTTITVELFMPSTSGTPYFTMGFSVPI